MQPQGSFWVTMGVTILIPVAIPTLQSLTFFPLPILNPWQSPICTPSLQFCYFENIIQRESYSIWLFEIDFLSLDIIPLRSIQVIACIHNFIADPFLWLSSISWYTYTTVCLTINLLKGFWAIMNKTAINGQVKVSVWTYVLISLGWMPKSAIAMSFHKYIFNFRGNYQTIWHSTPVFLPGKSHGWKSLVGCSPWGC